MPTWNAVDGWQGTGTYLSLSQPSSARCLLTEGERAEYERLAAWFLAWVPPTESFGLTDWITIADPAANHAYYAARIRAGVTGQVQRSILASLRLFATKFGGEP